jgi:hypothetical protein
MLKINPTKEAIDFHYEKVKERFNDIISKKYIERGKQKDKIILSDCFLNFLNHNFKELITAKPNRLLEIHQEYENLNCTEIEKKNIKSFFIQTGYLNFPNKEFLNELGIDTCIYCNRNYTLNLLGSHARAELDHWFPKSDFPILALSFYNLIPSCHSCNHIKLNNSPKNGGWEKALDNLNHPYESENEFSFSYNYKTFNDFQMKIMVEKESKSAKTLEFNKTEDIYNAHSNKELKDLLDLRYKYSKNYLDILLNKTFPNLSMSKEEAYRLIFGIEIKEEDYHKRPFSKFKKDIIAELLRVK